MFPNYDRRNALQMLANTDCRNVKQCEDALMNMKSSNMQFGKLLQ